MPLAPVPWDSSDLTSLLDVLQAATWPSSPEGAAAAWQTFYASRTARLWVLREGDETRGLIGLRATGPGAAEITHIAVRPIWRGQGIGRSMVHELITREGLQELSAETDGEAAPFYRRLGFAVRSLGERYPGVERFSCTLRTPLPHTEP